MLINEAWKMIERHGLNETSIYDGDDDTLKKAYLVLCEYFESGAADGVDLEEKE
jgi:hypothetical protein